ncbi:MFS transporter [Nocardiopsis gilva YIM 90087]|uniref:MFS transporter n=1 Tax=Nocardiopsis gilva YIM 90087 TaxID=1235441 RepID=A0A223SBD7_9ACTN|nr:MFS transporter [Nocardiopsis gilva]ASU85396.1 MFS transporter [Nocardiopsis gilva YIM 90087]
MTPSRPAPSVRHVETPYLHPLRLATAGAALIATCYGIARFAYGLFVPVLRQEFDLDAATAGLIASSSYTAYCIAIVVSMVVTGRVAPRRVAVMAGALATAGTALIASATDTATLSIGVVVAGASTGVASPPLAEAVAHRIGPGHRDRVQSVVNAGTGVGVMLSGPIALAAGAHWRPAWIVFALIALAVTAWNAWAVPPDIPRTERGGAPSLLPTPLLAPGAVRMLAAAVAMGAASSAVWTFGRDIVITEGGASPVASTFMWVCLGAAGVLGAFAGDIAARTGLGRSWGGTMLALGAATAGLALMTGSSAAVIVSAAAFGVFYTVLTGLLLLWGIRLYPNAPSFGVGSSFLMIAAGQAVGAPLVGVASDLWSPVTAFGLAAGAAALGALLRPRSALGPGPVGIR